MHSDSERQIAAAFGIESVLVPVLPELLADIRVLGSWPEKIVDHLTITIRRSVLLLVASLSLSSLSCVGNVHPCTGPSGEWSQFLSATFFKEGWLVGVSFDQTGRTHLELFSPGRKFFVRPRCGELTATEQSRFFEVWQLASKEAQERITHERAVAALAAFQIYPGGRSYVVATVEELDARPLLREAVVATLRISIRKYPGRFRSFIESHPLGILDVFPKNGVTDRVGETA